MPSRSTSNSALVNTSNLSPLCFHGLTNCFSRNSLVFKIFCVAPGVCSINNSARCAHRFPNSKRCRLYVGDLDSVYCSTHAQLPQNQQDSPETSAVLTADLKEFRPAIPINEFLARLLLLLAENKISARRAASLAYITNQLLRTLPAIDHELNPKPGKDEPVQIIFDMPGPNRDCEPAPEPTYADVRT